MSGAPHHATGEPEQVQCERCSARWMGREMLRGELELFAARWKVADADAQPRLLAEVLFWINCYCADVRGQPTSKGEGA